jgi:hypothetical protein
LTGWIPYQNLNIGESFKFDLRSACVMVKVNNDSAVYKEFVGTDKERPFKVWPDELITKV